MQGARVLRTLLVILLLVLLPATFAQQEVRLEFWTISLAPSFNSYIQETIRLYEEANPHVTVMWQDYSMERLGFELQNAVAAGRAPDVVNLNVPMMLEQAERGALLELGPLLGREADLFFAGMLRSFEVDGRQLGIPWYVTPPLVLYNRQIFEQAGLDPDGPPRNMAELFAFARQIRDQTGLYGVIPNLAHQNLLYRFLEAGLPVLSEDGTEALFNSSAHAAFLEELIMLQEAGYLPEDVLVRGHAGAVDRFMDEHLGMILSGPQLLPRLRTRNPDLYEITSLAPYPLSDGGVLHAPLMGLSVPRGARHPEEAVRFALFVTQGERMLVFSQRTAVFPTEVGAAQDPFFTQPDEATLEAQARLIEVRQLPHARDLTMSLPNASDLFRRFEYEIELAFARYKTPQEALDDIVKFWNSRL